MTPYLISSLLEAFSFASTDAMICQQQHSLIYLLTYLLTYPMTHLLADLLIDLSIDLFTSNTMTAS